jgi:HK97 family phage major capsid protein
MLANLLKQAQETRVAALAKIKALQTKIENRTWKEDEDAPALVAAKSELEAADKEVQRIQDLVNIEARSAGWSQNTTAPGMTVNILPEGRTGDRMSAAAQQYRLTRAIRMAANDMRLEGLEKEMHEEGINEMRAAGISNFGSGVLVPYAMRDITAGTTTEGGFTVQTDVARLIPFLDPRPIIARMGATMLTGLQGNIDFPVNDASATAVWATEQATSTETSPTFARIQMTPNRLTAYTEASMQSMRQSTINIEAFIRNRLMQARDNALDLAALTGGGGATPTGIIGATGVNTITVAASPTWAKIVDFETQIAADDADFGRLAYLTTPGVAGTLKTKIRDTAGNGFIWEGPNNGSGTVNGYAAYVSTTVPTTGGGHYMFFGNWQKLLVGQWGGMEIVVNPYTRLKDATVEVVLNTWHDVAVEHGQAFSYSSNVHPS